MNIFSNQTTLVDMKWAFLIGGIIELLGAVLLLLQPEWVFVGVFVSMGRLYGSAVLFIGFIHLIGFLHFSEERIVRLLFIACMGYHAAVSFVCKGLSMEILREPSKASLTHLICFIIFFIFYMKENRGKDLGR